MVDIDRFKQFNDTHGHPAGDRLLQHVSGLIRTSVRQSDIVYRFGGEEFAVLLPDASRSEALAVAERIRAVVESKPLDALAVTVSVGVSWAEEPDSGRLLESADAALYDAKRAGRNQVVASTG
jgi:diguanylate cyclase (GGDEF)-like protein